SVDALQNLLQARLPAGVTAYLGGDSVLGYKLGLAVAHDPNARKAGGKDVLAPASIRILPRDFSESVTVDNNSFYAIEQIATSGTDNTFVFGDDFGRAFLKSDLVIDSSETVRANKALVLDFRAVGDDLKFTFQTDPTTHYTNL